MYIYLYLFIMISPTSTSFWGSPKLLMTTTPFGGVTFTGGHVPEPSDQRTRDFDIFFLNC